MLYILFSVKSYSSSSSKFEDEFSEGQLGINDKELNSMNKHIPGRLTLLAKYIIVKYPSQNQFWIHIKHQYQGLWFRFQSLIYKYSCSYWFVI